MKIKVWVWLKLIGAAVAMVGIPVVVADFVLSGQAYSAGKAEVTAMADRSLERAEAVIGEGLATLAEIKRKGNVTCSLDDRMVMGRAAFASRHILQIGIADAGGDLLCGEPMGSLALPARLPAADPGDATVMLGILVGQPESQAITTMRVEDDKRLVARFKLGALDQATGPVYFADRSSVRVFLEDGSVWPTGDSAWQPTVEADAITATIASTRFPLKVTVSASRAAAEETMAPLRAIILIAATLVGVSFFAIAVWNTWRREEGDSFTRAVENQEFVPFYQPVFDLFTGELRGCEVLVRWRRPSGQMVPPGQFLPYAEATGYIREITRQLMVQTVQDCAEWYSVHPELKLSINLTAMHFNDLEILDEIRQIYGESGISYEQLCFEVTEQHPLKDLNLSRAIIGRIQALGASVALDDVGTGHGGLAYLQKLGVDIIKIDKMFIDNIGTDHSSQTIVDTLVELANQLGLGIIAEGVERQDQVEYLKKIGVATAQGYVFSPPVPAAAYLDICKRLATAPSAPAAAEPTGGAAETARNAA